MLLLGTIFGLRQGIAWVVRRAIDRRSGENVRFWTRQGANLGLTLLLVLALLSVWFDDPTRLATALGLDTAGLAFALQQVVTAIAGCFVILRGANFTVGDRIAMGGVRGDVIGLGFIQTTIKEMGQPPPVQKAAPAVWVLNRQNTGRGVTVTTGKIFEEPIHNYTQDFPYLRGVLTLPIASSVDQGPASTLAGVHGHPSDSDRMG